MKELWLFTRQFPTGRGETFLENALPVWAKRFGRVRVLPMFEDEGIASVPPGVEVLRLWRGAEAFAPLSWPDTLRHSGDVMRLLARGREGAPGAVPFAEALNHARQLARKAHDLRRRLMPAYDPRNVVLLCVWMEDWVNVLGLLKPSIPGMRIASMAHGWDLFEERRPGGRIPFRPSQMRLVDRVHCISESGRGYLRKRFPEHAEKVRLSPLGVPDRGAGPWHPDEVLRIASCAHLRPPKRVELLAEALRLVERPVHWTHFGDGPGRAELEALISRLPGNVRVDLKGAVANTELMDWYRSVPVDLFVHFSGHEGVPVSLMEAASFGIPLLANDVGGVGEIVGSGTGVLLPRDPGPEDVCAWLDGPGPDALRTPEARAAVRAQWKERFDAEKNFGRVAELLGEVLVPGAASAGHVGKVP